MIYVTSSLKKKPPRCIVESFRKGGLYMKYVIGAALGGFGGFLIYRAVGCSTGACPITSNPISSAIYGAVLGLFAAGSF